MRKRTAKEWKARARRVRELSRTIARKTKTHYHPKGTTGRGTICGRVLLGRKPNYTTHRDRVTCDACLRKMGFPTSRDVAWMEDLPQLEEGSY